MELLLEVVVLTSSSTEEQGGIFHQWHGEAYARFVDIATGRNRIRPRQRTLANISNTVR
jgi:hypothetical protein